MTQQSTLGTEPKPLIRKLTEKQKALAMNDAQFGMKLGVSRTWWNQVRLGYAHLGKSTLTRIMREFPDLMVDVLLYLQGESKDEANGR